MNLDNKKQVATIALAVGFGLVAAVLTGKYIQESINHQASRLKSDFEAQNAAQRQEMMQNLAAMQQQMEAKMEEMKRIQAQQKVIVQAAPRRQSPEEFQGAFSVKLPPGKRAMTVMIDSLSAIGGLVSPGDYVDIIAQLELPNTKDSKGKSQKLTSVIFQNIQVLAVGTNFNAAGSMAIYTTQQKSRSLNITLALDPEEAGLLTFAQTNGKIQMALRPPAENRTEVLDVASWETLSDFVLEQQGTKLEIPKKRKELKKDDGKDKKEDDRPFIQVFKSGKETSF